MNQPNYTMEQVALQIQKWLCGTIRTGKTSYLKSKDIGQSLGINPKTAGICLAFLCEEENHPFTIVKWGLSRSITWKITQKETWTGEDMRTYLASLEKEIERTIDRTDALTQDTQKGAVKDSADAVTLSDSPVIDETIIRV